MKEISKTVQFIVATVLLAAGGWCFQMNSQVDKMYTVLELIAENQEATNMRIEKVIEGHDSSLRVLMADNALHKKYNQQIDFNTVQISDLKVKVAKLEAKRCL